MSTRIVREPRFRRGALLVGAMMLLVGSSTRAGFATAPETVITDGPADSSASNYRVHFAWSGSDADGTVDHFEFILVDHPASKDSIGPGGVDPVVVTIPAPDDPRWQTAQAMDSTFITLADTLRRDPRPGPGETTDDVLAVPFDRWHTFFVRAVDNAGLPDSTPAFRSFRSQNPAPTVELLSPVVPNRTLTVPPRFAMHWSGNDPIDDFNTQMPDSSRWVILPTDLVGRDFTSFPDSLYNLPDRFQWSPWRAWDASDGSGVSAKILALPPTPAAYLFAVQAKDEAGAITPVFDIGTPRKNNVALILVEGVSGPVLTVEESTLGTARYVALPNTAAVDALTGLSLDFRWSGDASSYGGSLDAFRYGWDLVDPGDPTSWDVDWSPAALGTQRVFQAPGMHTLSIQARDDLGTVTGVDIAIQVHEFVPLHDVLLVDDAPEIIPGSGDEQREDVLWSTVLQAVADEAQYDFDPTRDIYDIADHVDEAPPLDLLLRYRTVIWDSQRSTPGSGLARSARFVDPFVGSNLGTDGNFSPLKAYLAGGGRLWVCGFRVADDAWTTARPQGTPVDPVNVTNWDDPLEPHPLIDSVGTTSLLYAHGIEMFDVGAGVTSTRIALNQFCRGFRAEVPGAPALAVDPVHWPLPSMQPGRPNVEIFNMPEAMTGENPPLQPPASRVQVLYSYVSGVPRDPSSGIVFPQTADGQPTFILARRDASEPFFSRAFCGFRPHLLAHESHVALTRYILLEAMRSVPVPVLLQAFTVEATDADIRVRWQLGEPSDTVTFELHGRTGDQRWQVPYRRIRAAEFEARDDRSRLDAGIPITYELYVREAGAAWVLLSTTQLQVASAVPRAARLLAPQPNPFNPRVVIPFVLDRRQRVTLSLFGADGRRVATLIDAVRPAGHGQVVWDGKDADGRSVASGTYVVRMQAGTTRATRKLVLVR